MVVTLACSALKLATDVGLIKSKF